MSLNDAVSYQNVQNYIPNINISISYNTNTQNINMILRKPIHTSIRASRVLPNWR